MHSWIFDNRTVSDGYHAESSTREPLTLHQRLLGYQPSPLVEAPGIAAALGVGRVWVKDESHRLGLPAFKILGASWAVYRAVRERGGPALDEWSSLADLARCLQPLRPLTLVTATDGNHGRAVAHMAALLRLEAHILVPAGTAQARIDAIAAEGAAVTVVDGSYDDAVTLAANEADAGHLVVSDTSWPGYESIPQWVIDGYATILWEIDEELARRDEPGPEVVVVQIGVGALAAAVTRHYRRAGVAPRPRIVGVEPTRAACVLTSMQAGQLRSIPGPYDSIMAGLNAGTPSLVAWPVISHGIDLFVAIDDERARQAMRDLARAGVEAGETGAAGLAGLTDLLDGPDAAARRAVLGLNTTSRVLLFCTEGATDPYAYRAIVGAPPPQPTPPSSA